MRRVVVLGVVLAMAAGAWQWSRLHRLRLADVRFAPIENVAAATGGAGAPVLNANKSHWLKACDQALGPMRVEVRATETPLSFSNDRSVEQLTELVGRASLKEIVRESTDLIERLCIEAALAYTSDNRASAAEILGLSRQSLYSKLHRYGLGNLVGETE